MEISEWKTKQGCRVLENWRRARKGLNLQHPTSSESCRSSTVDHGEERTLESLTRRQEVQEEMKETEWNETRGTEEKAWRLAPEGETEMLETGIGADGDGIYVDLNGEGHHGRGQVKNHRSQSGVPGDEGEEIKNLKRK